MILVDERIGSRELLAPLQRAGLEAELSHLDFADIAFLGRGIGGAPLMIGVELKRLPDLVQSITTDRLAGHQLPGLLRTYDPDLTGQRVYLVVEGEWKTDRNGRLVRRVGAGMWKPMQGSPPASALRKRLLTLATRAGVTVWMTASRVETVAFLTDLYRFWADSDLDSHRSHLAIYSPDVDSRLLSTPSIFRQVVAQLPGVGMKVAEAAETYFKGSLYAAMTASEVYRANVTTLDADGSPRRLGAKTAARIVQAINGKETH